MQHLGSGAQAARGSRTVDRRSPRAGGATGGSRSLMPPGEGPWPVGRQKRCSTNHGLFFLDHESGKGRHTCRVSSRSLLVLGTPRCCHERLEGRLRSMWAIGATHAARGVCTAFEPASKSNSISLELPCSRRATVAIIGTASGPPTSCQAGPAVEEGLPFFIMSCRVVRGSYGCRLGRQWRFQEPVRRRKVGGRNRNPLSTGLMPLMFVGVGGE